MFILYDKLRSHYLNHTILVFDKLVILRELWTFALMKLWGEWTCVFCMVPSIALMEIV